MKEEIVMKPYTGTCVDCNKVNTDGKDDGEFVCASCSNDRYFNDLSSGKRVEIKIKLNEYRQGTLEEVRAVLAKNKINLLK